MLNRLKTSLVLTPVVFLLVVGAYIYSLWEADRQRSADIPVEGTSMMMRDLLAFHEKRGGFPNDLKQLEGVIWKNARDRNFSNKGRGFAHRNYFYLYTQLNSHRFTLWAIPMGRSREDAATWFLMVSPDSRRGWKGAALPLEHVKKIEVSPSIAQLGVLGLIEQERMDFPKK